MKHLLYIHGFLSSPRSHKAVQVRNWLAGQAAGIDYHCPALTPYPQQTADTLQAIVEELAPEGIGLLGSSLGGYWATWLVENYDVPAVLVNPAVRPSMLKPDYVNVELKNYHSDDTYTLGDDDIAVLLAHDVPRITRHERYWLMVQAGDETLDYRQAVEKYRGCRQLVEADGDHSFQGFEEKIPEVIDFLAGSG